MFSENKIEWWTENN